MSDLPLSFFTLRLWEGRRVGMAQRSRGRIDAQCPWEGRGGYSEMGRVSGKGLIRGSPWRGGEGRRLGKWQRPRVRIDARHPPEGEGRRFGKVDLLWERIDARCP